MRSKRTSCSCVDLVEADAPARREAMAGLDDQDDAVLVEGRADDVRVAELPDEPEVDLLAEHELEHLLGMARCARSRRPAGG